MMPRYELRTDCYLDQPDERDPSGYAPRYLKQGSEIEYRGWPNEAMTPLDDEGRKLAAIVSSYRDAKPEPKPLPPFEEYFEPGPAQAAPKQSAADEPEAKPAVSDKRRAGLEKARAAMRAKRAARAAAL